MEDITPIKTEERCIMNQIIKVDGQTFELKPVEKQLEDMVVVTQDSDNYYAKINKKMVLPVLTEIGKELIKDLLPFGKKK